MSERLGIQVVVCIGSNAHDGQSYGTYQFTAMPRVGEEVLIDREQGGGRDDARVLQVNRVSHFPISLEAPMGDLPSSDTDYVMIFCSEK